MTSDQTQSNYNCCLDAYCLQETVVTNDPKQIVVDNATDPKNILFRWIQKYFPMMQMVSMFTQRWTNKHKYDFGSKKYKIIIQIDGPEHHTYVPQGTRQCSSREMQKFDHIKNKLAMSNGFTMMRIEQKTIVKKMHHWKRRLATTLCEIKAGHTRNVFRWISMSSLANKAYEKHEEKLYPKRDFAFLCSPQQKTTPSNVWGFNLKSKISNFTCFLKSNYQHLKITSNFTKKWMGHKMFTCGSDSAHLIISIDSSFFKQKYDKLPSDVRKSEIDKAIKAIRHGYTIIRIHYNLLSDAHLPNTQNKIKHIIDTCTKEDADQIIFMANDDDTSQQIYQHFCNDVFMI